MEHLPIDIHSNKLLDWLLSRRHCPKNWREAVEAVRSKISHAIQDMPENEQILTILSNAQYINYFHCKQIVDILRETEKETKNIFGMYSSQRMKDWKEIISLYEKDNVYLAEAANFLQRFVQYEVPALRKQIAKAENTSGESERKERDYAKQAAESRRNLDKDLAKWSLSAKVRDLRGELVIPPVADDGIARGEEALPILDHLGLRTEFLDELDQLASFMDFRLQDELTECGASIYLDGMAQKPTVEAGVEELRAWLTELKRTSAELSEPNKMQRLRMRTSPRFVDEIVDQLEQKRRLEAKYLRQEQLSTQRLTQCAAEIRSAQKLLDGVVEAAKGLQEELEKDLSKRYNGREVYIMGEINAVLYGS
uniref:CDK5 regulatory subunit associated protein 3 n=1 Tax=Globodera pallida TaxID=36090 RepID=A0A183CC37_GLOPA